MKLLFSVLALVFVFAGADISFAVGNPKAMKKGKPAQGPAPAGAVRSAPAQAAFPAANPSPMRAASINIDDVRAVEPAPAAPEGSGFIKEPEHAATGEQISGEATVKLVEEMHSSSAAWAKISDPAIKEGIVLCFIDEYKKKGVIIKRPAGYYVNAINSMAAQRPGILASSLNKILEIVAVMDYDFDNGQDKDVMAKKLLGDKGYEKNRKRVFGK